MIVLPKTYTKELWEVGGCRLEHEKYIGFYYVSWSQVESFNDLEGFNTGLLGEFEYIRKYFSGDLFPEMGWGSHGIATESYITVRNEDLTKLDDKTREGLEWAIKHFTKEGKELLDSIEPLGVFQREVCYLIKQLNVIVLGYIDDMTPISDNKRIKKIRDYKTKSKSSKKDLHLEKKFQLEIYQSAEEQLGHKVEETEYCVIDRSGGAECMRGGGKESLNIGREIWYEPYRKLTPKRKKEMDDMLVKTITKISDYYKVFLKIISKAK